MSTWLHNRVVRQDDAWPRRLVWCLPMRVLVEQTEAEARRLVEAMGLRWDEHGDHTGKVGVHLLMGGTDTGDWHLYPEECAILIGTQDMLLSRALNRGYASSRARWPMEFGLLNSDCLWVMDEVQLMGPGLWTSGQLDWMRNDRFGTLFPCHTWWMSATNSAGFLDTLDRQTAKMRLPDELSCSVDQVPQGLRGARRPCRMWQPPVQKGKGKPKKQKMSPDEFLSLLAGAVGENHLAGTLSLVVCNRVKTAQDIYRLLNTRGCGGAELVLLTSRFRRGDREVHTKRLLSFEANRKAGKVQGGPGLICVATQVVEAGVDISATRLWSEVAPWPCLVQRMGRLNRDGRSNEHAQAVFFEVPQAGGERKATDRIGPYAADDVNLGRSLAERLCQVHGASDGTVPALEALARVSHSCQADVDRALAPKPEPFPRAIDVHGLFDTEPDLFGGFTDVSPFIRGQDEQADVTVFWREFNPAKPAMVPGDALTGPAFDSDEGCSVAVHRLRGFLDETNQAWVWGEAEGCWREIRGADVCPGMVVLLPRSAGGYSEDIGWTGTPADKLTTASAPGPFEEAFAADPPTEQGFWVMIPDHLADAVSAGQQILERLGLGVARPLVAQAVAHAIAHHDIGKALLPWQNALPLPRPKMDTAEPWAKAPLLFAVEPGTCDLHPDAVESVLSRAEVRFLRCPDASPALKGTRILWQTDRPVVDSVASRPRTAIENLPGHPRAYMVSFRPGLRHELASGLALWHQYFREGGNFPALSIYLATTHHGKVRTILTARNLAGDDVCGIPLNTGPLPWQGGMPMDFACVVDGCAGAFTPDGTGFVSESPGWTALVADLLGGWEARPPDPVRLAVRDNAEPAHLGPFALAYLEAVVRCGDARASRNPSRKVPVGGSES
ncbi:MAG: hypothetical protein A3K19_21785 [Lentisphaerae bacterium RIFOXYB12_FULL_65_16]|nr:MAG: hypothetical protein A3K18_21035 [Lentisphaerae bacterium RIFOXYA12_64_32]OGV93949.1 MAG: hypothetical protein A3K19_21785 [Lentisphaerae bacterium RIFOXYB12_FULL_65_16]